LLRYFAELLGKPLDQAGVTVIDFQNNGSPGKFIGLARTFEIPWLMMCDNDGAGKGFIEEIRNRGLTNEEIKLLVQPLPEEDIDLEMFLVKNGFVQEYIQILIERNVNLIKQQSEAGFEDEIVSKIQKDKTESALSLIEKLRTAGTDESRVPQFFRTIIEGIVAKVA
jgi:putative ATP-dependent endonuclease of OLD family